MNPDSVLLTLKEIADMAVEADSLLTDDKRDRVSALLVAIEQIALDAMEDPDLH